MSFWKGFFSVFNLFPSSKSYDDIREEVDELLQHDGWGEYSNATRSMSCNEWNNSIRKVTQSEFLDEMIKLVPKDKFVPYSYYNKDRDAIQVYWSNDESYTVPVGNGSMNLKIAFGSKEIVGVDILNANQLVIENRQPLTLDEQQRYAIYWLYDRYISDTLKEPLIVHGVNITEIIQGLTGRLF